jgi:biopolymer transport protein ExbD
METLGNCEEPNRERRSIFIHGMDPTCLAAVYIAILFILTPSMPQHPGNKPVDLATVKHSVPMLGAHREDATIVTVTRDGNVFVGNTQVQLADVPSQIAKSLAQGGARKGILRRMPEQNMVTSKQ